MTKIDKSTKLIQVILHSDDSHVETYRYYEGNLSVRQCSNKECYVLAPEYAEITIDKRGA
jgi:hypothetical protein